MYLIGYDIGSSSVKASIVGIESGEVIARTQYPKQEMAIQSPQAGWAEQDPEDWWTNLCLATRELLQQEGITAEAVQGIGIAYQMHGLVIVDDKHAVLRPSIIWCDSRAVQLGDEAFDALGHEFCLEHYLNSPGNFTASKLRWVIQNQPELYKKIKYLMLPGDYIAMRLTGEPLTTVSGLSEGILWDFKERAPAKRLLDYYGIDERLIPSIVPTFSEQGKLSSTAAAATGLAVGTPVTYRAGDQPNNALCLNVLHPGEIAATGGTSGVVYGVVDRPVYDPQSRVNGFAHVNYSEATPNIGVLLCINGSGIQYSWLRQLLSQNRHTYSEMETLAQSVASGADGLRILPFGNGAERMLSNRDIGARINGLQFNRHGAAQLYRAALEGIAFSFVYGLDIMREMGLQIDKMRVGNDNLFQSAVFSNAIAGLAGTTIEVVETTGAIGAAKAAGLGIGAYTRLEDALGKSPVVLQYEPPKEKARLETAYRQWYQDLEGLLR